MSILDTGPAKSKSRQPTVILPIYW